MNDGVWILQLVGLYVVGCLLGAVVAWFFRR